MIKNSNEVVPLNQSELPLESTPLSLRRIGLLIKHPHSDVAAGLTLCQPLASALCD